MTRRIFHCLCTIAAVSALLPSCAKVEMIDGGAQIDPDQIAFGVTTGVTSMPEMRGGSQEEEAPAMLLGPGGEDTLYLHPSVIANDRGFSSPGTRGEPKEDADGITSFFVTAKVNDAGNPAADALYFDETKVEHAGNGVWTTTDGKHFWPDGQTTLDFYAYSNLASSDGSEGSTAPAGNLKMEDGTLSFSYTVPGGTTAGTGTPASTDAAKQQPDILFALASANRTQTQEGSGTVALNFQHALAGVQFRAKNIAGGTIRSITLKNLYGQGDCTYTLSDETTDSGARKNGTFEWSNLGGESKTRMDFVQNMSVEVKESSTQPDGTLQDVTTGANNEMTFMMIPQSAEGVEVEIELLGALDEKTYTVSGKLSGPDSSSPIKWEAGNIYIYDISTDSINWTYVFEVTPSITLPLGDTTGSYTVTSYRYRTQDKSVKEAVPWSAEPVDNATETVPDLEKGEEGGQSFPIKIKDILVDFTSKGAGLAGSAENLSMTLERGTLHTTYYGDSEMKDATPKGTPEDPYDLSTSGGSRPRETANCYAINSPGTYKLPLVYGNAIKNNQTNTQAFQGHNFKDYLDRDITGPWITSSGTPADACLVWSDGFYMVEDVHLEGDYLVFTINPEYMQQANAVVAVRDSQRRIMWSWHIWVTDRTLAEVFHLQDGRDGSLDAYGMMKCNLGWVDGKEVYYNSRDLNFVFTQEYSGLQGTLKVHQTGAAFDYKDVGSTYYQWGRKDPLVALRNWSNVKASDYRLHETSDPKYIYTVGTGSVSLGTAIQNPNIFYTRGSTTNWLSSDISSLWDASATGGGESDRDKKTSVKTIYDPSPRGYKVPVPRAFSVLVNNSTESGNYGGSFNGVPDPESELHNRYLAFEKKNKQGEEIPLTGTGQRADRAGLEAYEPNDGKGEIGGLWSMFGVYYWSCIQKGSAESYTLVIRKDYPNGYEVYSYGFGGAKTMARPVRCIEDR